MNLLGLIPFALEAKPTKVLGIDLDKLWWSICSGLMKIIDWLEQTFNFLIGVDKVDQAGGTGESAGEGAGLNSLFQNIFNGAGGKVSMTTIYLHIMVFCAALLLIFVGIGAIKSQFSKSPTESLANLGMKSLFAFIKMICIPAVFFVAIGAMTVIFEYLVMAMSQGTRDESIAQSLCNSCFTPSGDAEKIDFFASYDGADTGTVLWAIEEGAKFDYLMCILSSAFLMVTLVTVSISLTKRIIEIFFYYLTAPIAICRTPLDDGKSFELWKDNVISKFLSAGGIIIALYLYYAILPIFTDSVDTWVKGGGDNMVGAVLKLLFIIGASAVPASASMMMSQLISQGAGQNESNNMMHTQQMLGNAMRATTAIGGKAFMGALSGSTKLGGTGGSLLAGTTGAAFTAKASAGAAGAAAGAASARTDSSASAGFKSAARPGAAARAAAVGRTGGSQGTAQSGASSADGGSSTRAASGSTVTPRASFGENVSSNLKGAWSGGASKIKNASPYLGIAGKVGAAAAVGAVGLAKTVAAVPKAGIQALGGKAADSKMARHAENKMGERRAKKDVVREQKEKAKLDARNSGKYSSLDKAMNMDKEAGTKENTSEYMMAKMNNYEARAAKIESFLDKQKGWDEGAKQKYRRTQLEKEANRISAYADTAHHSMNDDSIKRFKGFYDKMNKDLYGEIPKAKAKRKTGASE